MNRKNVLGTLLALGLGFFANSDLARSHSTPDEAIEREVTAFLEHYIETLEGGDEESLVRQFPSERRNLLQKWFNSCLKDKPDRGKETEVYAALLEALEEVEHAD